MDKMELYYDILFEMGFELDLDDYFRFMMVNDLTSELRDEVERRIEYYYVRSDMFGSQTKLLIKGKERYSFGSRICRSIYEIIVQVIYSGDIVALCWFNRYRRSLFLDNHVLCACHSGNLEILKWFHENRYELFTNDAFGFAASHGHLDVLKWFLEHRPDDINGSHALVYASEFGRLNVLEWVYTNTSLTSHDEIINGALSYSNLHVLKWLYEITNRALIMPDLVHKIHYAELNGAVDIVGWLRTTFNGRENNF